MVWRIKAGIYVQALLRRVYAAQAAGYVVRRGDADAGDIFIRINTLDGCSGLLRFFTFMDGERGWRVALPPQTPDSDIEELLRREKTRDPDMWIIEIEDRHGRHFLEERIEGAW